MTVTGSRARARPPGTGEPMIIASGPPRSHPRDPKSRVRVTGTGSGAGRGESRTPGGAVTPAVAAGPSDRACSPTDLKHYSTVIRTPPRRAAGGRGVLSDRRPGRYARRPAAGRGPGTLSGVTVASEALA